MTNDGVDTEVRASVFYSTIVRPSRHNAMNEAVCARLSQVLDQAEADPTCRVIVLTGQGDAAFCAGGDLSTGTDCAPFPLTPANPGHYARGLFRRMDACRLSHAPGDRADRRRKGRHVGLQ